MAIRVLFDCNVPDSYESWSDEGQKQALVTAFQARRFTFYPSTEFFEETLCLAVTERVGKLPQRAAWLLQLMNGRTLNYYGDIVLAAAEFRGQDTFIGCPR